MLYHKEGLPVESEIVLCKVTKIEYTTVFVELLDYPGKYGIVHISEIAPGRIRNIRDYISMDRQIVCKILYIDQRTGNIDLSLRRVNTKERMEKLDEIKQELKAETILKGIAAKLKRPLPELYQSLKTKIFKEYPYLFSCFKEVAAGNVNLEKLGVEPVLAKEITQAVIEKFKPQKIGIKGQISLKTYHPDGIDKLKKVLLEINKISKNIALNYLGGGKYQVAIEDIDYKPAEKNLKKIQELLEKFNDKHSTASFEREKND